MTPEIKTNKEASGLGSGATPSHMVLELEMEYFVTRVLYNVELLYSLSKRKFVRPMQVDYPIVRYRLYPGFYIQFWGWWESGRDHVIVRVAPVRVRQKQGIRGEIEKIYEKWACVKYKQLRDLLSSPDVPQQFKDFARMTSRPINPRLFRIIYSDEEHAKLIRIMEEQKEIRTW